MALTYDANGSAISRAVGAASRTLVYNDDNKLSQVTRLEGNSPVSAL